MQIGSLSLLASDQMGALDYVLAVVALLAGLGAFLFGFKVLSDNIEKLATNRLRRWFEKTGRSRLAGVGIGAGVRRSSRALPPPPSWSSASSTWG